MLTPTVLGFAQESNKLRGVVKGWLEELDTAVDNATQEHSICLPASSLPSPDRVKARVVPRGEEDWNVLLPLLHALPEHTAKYSAQVQFAAAFKKTDQTEGNTGMLKVLFKRDVPQELMMAMEEVYRAFKVCYLHAFLARSCPPCWFIPVR